MGTRTRLTTPTGELPESDVPRERWVPGPRVPDEPVPHSRARRLLAPGVAGLVLGLAISLTVILVTDAANQDPALDSPGAPPAEQPAQVPDEEGLPGEG